MNKIYYLSHSIPFLILFSEEFSPFPNVKSSFLLHIWSRGLIACPPNSNTISTQRSMEGGPLVQACIMNSLNISRVCSSGFYIRCIQVRCMNQAQRYPNILKALEGAKCVPQHFLAIRKPKRPTTDVRLSIKFASEKF